jgi:hypothetical protein
MRNSANGELNEADILVHLAHACLPNTKVLNRTQSETRSQRNDERGSMIICRLLRWRIRQVNLLMSSAVVDGRAPARNHRDRWTVARSPWRNAYVERLSGICADLIFSNDTSLEGFPTRCAMCRALVLRGKTAAIARVPAASVSRGRGLHRRLLFISIAKRPEDAFDDSAPTIQGVLMLS